MADDLDLGAVQTEVKNSQYFCSCGAMIQPTAVATILDNEKKWELFDECVDYVDDDSHVRRPRVATQLLSSKAAIDQFTKDEIKEMTENELLERKPFFCKTCAREEVHCIFMTSRENMEMMVACAGCLSVSPLKNVWTR